MIMRAWTMTSSLIVGSFWLTCAVECYADPPQAPGNNQSLRAGFGLASNAVNGNSTPQQTTPVQTDQSGNLTITLPSQASTQTGGQTTNQGTNSRPGKGRFTGGPLYSGKSQNGDRFVLWQNGGGGDSRQSLKNSPFLQGMDNFHDHHWHHDSFEFVKSRERELMHDLKRLLEREKHGDHRDRLEREIRHDIKMLQELLHHREHGKLHEMKRHHEMASSGRKTEGRNSSMFALLDGGRGKNGLFGGKSGMSGSGNGSKTSTGGTTGTKSGGQGTGKTGGQSGKKTGGAALGKSGGQAGSTTGGKGTGKKTAAGTGKTGGGKGSTGGMFGSMPTKLASGKSGSSKSSAGATSAKMTGSGAYLRNGSGTKAASGPRNNGGKFGGAPRNMGGGLFGGGMQRQNFVRSVGSMPVSRGTGGGGANNRVAARRR
jgi:hypothetical protein